MMNKNSRQEGSCGSGPCSPVQIAVTARRKGRYRTGCLGIVALLLWASVATGAIVMASGIFVFIWPSLTHVASLGAKATERDWAHVETALRVASEFGMPLMYVWGGLVIMAAIVTMLYVRSSHNASLVRIRAELQDISNELRRLAQEGCIHTG